MGDETENADAVTRSRVSDGRVVGWYGEPGTVVDAEIRDRPPPARLGARFGVEDFWRRWTRAECAAKLADVPMHLWLRRHGLGDPGSAREGVGGVEDVEAVTLDVEDLVVSIARRVR